MTQLQRTLLVHIVGVGFGCIVLTVTDQALHDGASVDRSDRFAKTANSLLYRTPKQFLKFRQEFRGILCVLFLLFVAFYDMFIALHGMQRGL